MGIEVRKVMRGLILVAAVCVALLHGAKSDTDIKSVDVKECVSKLVTDCQSSMIMLLTAQNKSEAKQNLKQCIATSGLSTVCDSVVTPDGKPTAEFQAALAKCGTDAMTLCPSQSIQASTAAIAASQVIKSGGQLDKQTLDNLWAKSSAVFKCLKLNAQELSDTCDLVSEDDMAAALNNIPGQTTELDGKDGKHDKPGSDDNDGDGGAGFFTIVVIVLVVAAASAGVTWFVLKRRQDQAQTLHAQVAAQPHQPAAVVTASAVTPPSYAPVPAKSPLNNV